MHGCRIHKDWDELRDLNHTNAIIFKNVKTGTCVRSSVYAKFCYHAVKFQIDWYAKKVSEPMKHPDYQAIIAIGMDVVPFLIHEFSRIQLPWLPALREIVGMDPANGIPDSDLEVQRARWCAWAEDNRIGIPPDLMSRLKTLSFGGVRYMPDQTQGEKKRYGIIGNPDVVDLRIEAILAGLLEND